MDQRLLQPALATPPGAVSHFPDTYSNAHVIYYPTAVLVTVVPGVLFILRIHTKISLTGGLDITDAMLSLAWPFFLACVVLGWKVVSNGGGAHQWNLRNADYIRVTYYYYLVEIIYCPCMFFLKTAIVLQFKRLFAPRRSMNPSVWWAAYIYIFSIGIFYTISTFLTTFSCNPREAAWNSLITDAKCLDNNILIVFNCFFNIVSDIMILCLPIRAVWKLQMPTRRRIGIIAVFAIGLLACISSGMIIYYLFQGSGPASTADISYYLCWAGFWAFAEISFGFIASSAIILPRFFHARVPLFKRYWSSLFSRPFSSLRERIHRSSQERSSSGRSYELHSGNKNNSSLSSSKVDNNGPKVLPEINHMVTMTFFNSKTDNDDRDDTSGETMTRNVTGDPENNHWNP